MVLGDFLPKSPHNRFGEESTTVGSSMNEMMHADNRGVEAYNPAALKKDLEEYRTFNGKYSEASPYMLTVNPCFQNSFIEDRDV